MRIENICSGKQRQQHHFYRGVVYIVISSLPATEETGAMGREIESRKDFFVI
jgi:hypothetical protein